MPKMTEKCLLVHNALKLSMSQNYYSMKSLCRIIKINFHMTIVFFYDVFNASHAESMKLWIRFFPLLQRHYP